MPYDIFISYARADFKWVQQLAWRLRSSNLSVWLDAWQIRPGDTIATKINEGLTESATAIVICSRASMASGWVEQEMAAVFQAALRFPEQGKRLIPVKIEDCRLPPLTDALRTIDFTDIDPRSHAYDDQFRELLRAFSDRLSSLKRPPVGVPMVFASLTAEEVGGLFDGSAFAASDASLQAQFEHLVRELKIAMGLPAEGSTTILRDRLRSSYGMRREDWRPYGMERTILEVVERRFDDFNATLNIQRKDPIFPDLRSEEFFAPEAEVRTRTFLSLSQRGFYLLLDPLAFFHPRMLRVLTASQLLLSEAVTILCASPVNLRRLPILQIVENNIESHLEALFGRFGQLNPQCVLGAEDISKLDLWLKTQLPSAVDRLKGESPSEENLEIVRNSVQTPPRGIGALISQEPIPI